MEATPRMEPDELKRLLKLMDENGLAELEIEEEGRRVRLRKHETAARAVPAAAPAPSTAPAPAATHLPGPHPAPAAVPENHIHVKSPLVGTFYRSPKPDADAFVEVGDRVTAEKVVCIIEAMKVMNEIKAEVEGTVKEILIKSGQPVEYGEPLFVIEKR